MTVQIHGRTYITVAERLQLLHQSGKTFEIVASEPLQAGERWLWRVTVKIDDRLFFGSAEVHLNAKPGSADATDAWACAETSAVGRALGFANFGAIESIASADEIVRGETSAKPIDLKARLTALVERAKTLGIAKDNTEWASMLRYLEISKVRGEAELDVIAAYLDQQAQVAS